MNSIVGPKRNSQKNTTQGFLLPQTPLHIRNSAETLDSQLTHEKHRNYASTSSSSFFLLNSLPIQRPLFVYQDIKLKMSLPPVECIYLTEDSIKELKNANSNFKFPSPAPVLRFLYELCWTVVLINLYFFLYGYHLLLADAYFSGF